jgi:hypothetical protein
LPAMAVPFRVDLNTSPLAGSSGFVDLQLNPADGLAPSATATVTGAAGDLVLQGAPLIDGAVQGALPGTVTLANGTAFNDYFQTAVFGNSFSFLVDFAGDFLSSLSASGSSFALSLYDDDGVSPLLTTDPSGALLRFDLSAAGITFQTFADAQGRTAATVTPQAAAPVPAPTPLLLMGVGLLSWCAARVLRTVKFK